MNDARHDDDLSNKADWLEELLTGLILDIKKGDGTTVHTNSVLVLARPGSEKQKMFSKIKSAAGI
ncbi:hypothetical protein [Sphingopyxis sp. L1A2A]|uniref:hypothetical protein n=1 Tax=Sphingopyxis sp. L1A2A TaxID=2502247 RepID=UPI0010F89736|nr:hypothetical protein [Sphingopyxis sp. L1A2A]